MEVNNQHEYWDRVAYTKTFTHPVDIPLLRKYLKSDNATIVDYGCGYGRVVEVLRSEGFTCVEGYDTSYALIERGAQSGISGLYHIGSPDVLPVANGSADCVVLFAVLTCMPGNAGQQHLIELLGSKLKQGGIMYISDYYLQKDSEEVGRYSCYNDDSDNYGVFSLPEGVTFRHHTKEWIKSLLRPFEILEEVLVPVRTMNGAEGEAFQIIARKR